ncbi:hypothetical protein P3X46_006345 [Hevea brasiliensis]|uniref:Uncharacterized protein n=2 Tax=Hevea brasiliensis TaxID=3981 RepID=A0ABQ9MPX6_HEVBR|nr:uncharacterized protein LOC110657915 isoform X1 [Hevea brasiliensis]KAJ9182341.1 hypothetical protein P3X46_006345 [Hevea brasiliensis]
MLLRNSSNPATVTLISPFSGSPSRDLDTINTKHHHLNLTPFSCGTLSPFSELNQEASSFRLRGFRRAWSDSNLERLEYPSCDKEELHFSTTPNKFPKRHCKAMLRGAPSFSIFNVNDVLGDQENRGGDVGREQEDLMRTITIGDSIEAKGSGEFNNMGLIEEEGDLNGIENLNLEEAKEPVSPPLYLASGLGIDGIDFGGGNGGGVGGFDLTSPNFNESGDLEEYYKRMVDEFPCHPLFLANYAQLLQSKGDLHGAEDYYHRATLADPEDGEILLKYAKLEWQLHHDQGRALSNYERAIQAAPQDSHVLAAYASFLWEIDDDGEEDTFQATHIKVESEENLTMPGNSATNQDFKPLQVPPRLTIDVADHSTSDSDTGNNVEEYYRRMVEENPSNSLVLRNYAQFLYQKGDLPGAEEYYSRAVLADPGDGEIMSHYAKLVWEAHRDHSKASSFFEQAVQAAPEDSHVVAAYASFLWETEGNEEDSTNPDQFHNEGSVTTA